MTMNPSKSLVIVTMPPLIRSVTLLSAIDLFEDNGYSVYIVNRKPEELTDPVFDGRPIFIFSIPWIRRFIFRELSVLRFCLTIAWLCLVKKPKAVIAINPEGLVFAGPIAVALGVPLIHYSLEIRYAIDWRWGIIKFAEKFLNRYVKFTIIQDQTRAQALLESNKLKSLDMIFVPNSTGSIATATSKSNYLQKKLGIPESQKIILYAGGIQPITLTKELAEAAQDWPKDWTLVIHGWVDDPQYLSEILSLCDGDRIILSMEIVPFDQLGDLVSSAQIGIALYKNVDRNIYDMATASGKIWQYLQSGLPVVTVDFPSLKQMVGEGDFGVCIHQVCEIQTAIMKIFANYEYYEERARAFFRLKGDFSENFKPVLNRLQTF